MTRAFEMSRRGFLATLGLGAAMVPVFRPGRSMAQAAPAQPTRFVFMFSPNGLRADSWHPTPGRTERDFTLRGVLAPLADEAWMKSKLLVLHNVFNQSAENGGPGSPHVRGIGSLLTGREMQSGSFANNGGQSGFANGKSLDQMMVSALRTRSMQLGVHVNTGVPSGALSYAGANQPLAAANDPYQVYSDLFGDSGAAGARMRSRRQSVLDLELAQLTSLRGQLGADDRERLDSHIDALHSIQSDLAVDAATSCAAPALGAAPGSGTWYNDPNRIPDVADRHIRLLAAAFACGRARVATLQFGSASSTVSHPFLNSPPGHPIYDTFHGLSHAAEDDAACPTAATAGCSAIVAARAKLDVINTWHATQFANLMRAFQAVTYADGSTMLDHTVIVWGNELGDGSTHSHHDVPLVMAGSCGGYFNTGRYLQYDANNPPTTSQLLVSLANAMGMTGVSSVGNPDYGMGPLPNLR